MKIKIRIIFTFVLLSISFASADAMYIASDNPRGAQVLQEEDTIYTNVEQEAEYPGGKQALLRYVRYNCVYPATAQEYDIQGAVLLHFVVEKDGSVGEVKVVKPLYPACDEEAIRVVKSLKRFTPAKIQNRPVRSWFALPVRFAMVDVDSDTTSQGQNPIAKGNHVLKNTEDLRTNQPASGGKSSSQKEEIFTIVEHHAEYPGGEQALLNFFRSNIQYPAIAQEEGIMGTVMLRFVVEKDGSVGDVKVVKSVHPACDKEAVRVVKKLKKFKPARHNGKPVRSWVTMPVRFALQ